MTIGKTKDYSIFKLRDDNRCKIFNSHIQTLIKSIKEKDLLKHSPIKVTKDFEVIDGQHRLKAAEELGIDIYFTIIDELIPEDMILLNTTKSWGVSDYLNYYVKNGFEEYIKLNEFMQKYDIKTKAALSLFIGMQKNEYSDYKMGRFKYKELGVEEDISICKQTIKYIKKVTGVNSYLEASKFWQALLILVRHPEFKQEIWMRNLERNISKVGPRAGKSEYIKLFVDIYNWHNQTKIKIGE